MVDDAEDDEHQHYDRCDEGSDGGDTGDSSDGRPRIGRQEQPTKGLALEQGVALFGQTGGGDLQLVDLRLRLTGLLGGLYGGLGGLGKWSGTVSAVVIWVPLSLVDWVGESVCPFLVRAKPSSTTRSARDRHVVRVWPVGQSGRGGA